MKGPSVDKENIAPHRPPTHHSTNPSTPVDFAPKTSVFYLDLLDNPLLPRLIKYVLQAGGRCATFLDRSVTHMVTDKAKSVAEAYPKAMEWSINVWTVEEFASSMLKYMDGKGGSRVTASPTLIRVAMSRKRDLSQYLQDEKRAKLSGSRVLQSMTPMQAKSHANPSFITTTMRMLDVMFGASNNASNASTTQEKAAFHLFAHPFVYISEQTCSHAAVWKEWQPGTKYPMITLDANTHGCPFNPQELNKAATPRTVVVRPRRLVPPPLRPTTGGMLTRSKAARAQQPLASHTTITTLRASNTMTHQNTEAKMEGAQQHGMMGRPTSREALKAQDKDKENVRPLVESKQVSREVEEEHTMGDGEVIRSVALVNPLLTKAGAQQPAAPKARPRPGYCECCYEKYNELEKHVKSMVHRQYALQEDNYKAVDGLLVCMDRPLVQTSWGRSSDLPPTIKSPLSPVSTTSSATLTASAAGRNYTTSKRLKQNLALKHLNLRTSADITETECAGASSPSLKRRRSHRTLRAF